MTDGRCLVEIVDEQLAGHPRHAVVGQQRRRVSHLLRVPRYLRTTRPQRAGRLALSNLHRVDSIADFPLARRRAPIAARRRLRLIVAASAREPIHKDVEVVKERAPIGDRVAQHALNAVGVYIVWKVGEKIGERGRNRDVRIVVDVVFARARRGARRRSRRRRSLLGQRGRVAMRPQIVVGEKFGGHDLLPLLRRRPQRDGRAVAVR